MISYYSKKNKRQYKLIISANFINYYLFKEESLFNSYVSIAPTLAAEMETRVPARLGAMQKTLFYHLITDGEQLNAFMISCSFSWGRYGGLQAHALLWGARSPR